MARILYGVWNGKVTDNRDKRFFEIEEVKEFDELDEFDPANPVKAFLGAKGFFVFDQETNILDAAFKYVKRAAEESCGKCTPCRVGTQVLQAKLEELSKGEITVEEIEEVKEMAAHIQTTSLCGLGQTATSPLIEILNHFPDEFEKQIGNFEKSGDQPGTTYVTAPCIEECPSKVDIPKYIEYIKDSKFNHSVGVVLQKYPMAATCGRVCVRFCEAGCRRADVDEPVGIKVLKRFVADKERYVTDHWFNEELVEEKKSSDLKVAVIGTGPAGISAAYHLLLKGYHVDVYEAQTEPGGMAGVGIPKYRLPKEEILNKEVSIVESLGAKIYYGQKMGKDFNLSDLYAKGYKSIFIGVGAQKAKKMGIPGEDESLDGYVPGVEFLLYVNQYAIDTQGEFPIELGKKVLVVGGGNVAMDCARSALRMGAEEVNVAYRRAEEQMPADDEEIHAAKEEGIVFSFLSQPNKIVEENGKLRGVEFIKMELGQKDESGRRSVTPIADSEFTIEADTVIVAIGQAVDTSFVSENDGVEFHPWKLMKVDENSLMTTRKGVFAGGDCVLGPATLIQAMAQGEKAATSIDEYLTHGRVMFHPEERMSKILKSVRAFEEDKVIQPIKHQYRVKVEELEAGTRKKLFDEVEKCISTDEAFAEAERCMRCYRVYSVITEH